MPERVLFQEIVKIVESAGRIDIGDIASQPQIPEREVKNAIQDLADRVKEAEYVCICCGRAAAKAENPCPAESLWPPLFFQRRMSRASVGSQQEGMRARRLVPRSCRRRV